MRGLNLGCISELYCSKKCSFCFKSLKWYQICFYFLTLFFNRGFNFRGFNFKTSQMVPFFENGTKFVWGFLPFYSIGGLISGGLISEFLKWYHFSKMVPNLFGFFVLIFNRGFNFRGFNFRISQMVPFFENGTNFASGF